TVRRFQSLGIDFGMKPGFERMHWLLEGALARPGRFSHGFLEQVQTRTSQAGNPLFWTLQESIYGTAGGGATAWAAQAERDRRPEFSEANRPLLFTREVAFPWMFEEIRLLRGFAPAVHRPAERQDWPALYDESRLAENEVPLAGADVYDAMYVDAQLQLDTLSRVGSSTYWVTNEFEHDGIGADRTFSRLRELVRDRGGERTGEMKWRPTASTISDRPMRAPARPGSARSRHSSTTLHGTGAIGPSRSRCPRAPKRPRPSTGVD